MSEPLKDPEIIPRSKLQTIAHLADGEGREATKNVIQELRNRGYTAKERLKEISGQNYFAVAVPSGQTNIQKPVDRVYVIPDFEPKNSESRNIAIVTPN